MTLRGIELIPRFLQEHMDSRIWNDMHPSCLASIDAIRPYLLPSSGTDIPPKIHLADPYFPCPVIRDMTTGRLAGTLALRHSIRVPGEWEMSYGLLPQYRGRRLVKEAFQAAVEGWIKWTGIEVLEAVSLLIP